MPEESVNEVKIPIVKVPSLQKKSQSAETNEEALIEERVEEKICLLRSLTSVAETFTQQKIDPDPQATRKRLVQIRKLEIKINQKIHEGIMGWEKRVGKKPIGQDVINLSIKANAEVELEDDENIKEFIDSLLTDKENPSPLEKGLKGLTVEYRKGTSLVDIMKSMGGGNKVCIMVPGHIMHVGFKPEAGGFVSLSDLDSVGNPTPIGSRISSFVSFGQNGKRDNMIVFSRKDNLGKTSK